MKEMWNRLAPPVRWVTVGLVACIPIVLGVVMYLNQPTWVTLVSNLSAQDASAVTAKLDELKVQYKPSGDTNITISVRDTDKYTARLALGSANLPPSSSFTLDWFNDPKYAATDADRKINEMRGRAGEMEQALLRISDIESATVKLNPPQQSAFVRNNVPGSAAVVITTRAGRTLEKKQVWAIIKTVSGGLGIPDTGVTVVDQFGRDISRGVVDLFANGDYNPDDVATETKKQQEFKQSLLDLFEPMYGPGNVAVSVYVSINHASEKTSSTTVTQGAPTSKTTTSEGTQGTSQPNTQAPNNQQQSTTPTYQATTPPGNQDTFKNTDTTQYQNGSSTVDRFNPGGNIQKISVGITINKDLTPTQKAEVQKTAAKAVGATEDEVSVIATAFPAVAAAAVTPATTTQQIPRMTLALTLAGAAMALIMGWFFLRRRPGGAMALPDALPEPEPLLADLPSFGAMPGTTLDVALGLDGAGGSSLSGMPGGMPGGLGGGFPGGLPGGAAGGLGGMPGGLPGGMPGGGPVGLPGGLPGMPDMPAAAAGAGPMSITDEPDGGRSPIMQTPRQRVEFIMASRPKRQVILDGQPVDEELMTLIDDLIDSNPQGCAEIIRQWIKEGRS